MYEPRLSPGKGQGLFATQHIPRGTRIICEGPLFQVEDPTVKEIYSSFLELPWDVKEDYLSLTHGASNESITFQSTPILEQQRAFIIQKYHLIEAEFRHLENEIDDALKVFAIFLNNSFDLVDEGDRDSDSEEKQPVMALFLQTSRINHSCLPNTVHSWNPILRQHTVHAARDIQIGEEITLTYVLPFSPREERVQALQDKFAFTCDCAACDLSTDFGRASERRRKRLVDLDKQLSESLKNYTPRAEHGDMALEMLKLLDEEGLNTWERGGIHYTLSVHQQSFGSVEDVRVELEKAAEAAMCCFGEDSPSTSRIMQGLSKVRAFLDRPNDVI